MGTTAFARAFCISLLFSFSLPAMAGPAPLASDKDAVAEWDRIVSEYADSRFQQRPSIATEAGVHRYDAQLERFDGAAVEARRRSLQATLDRLSLLDLRRLPPPQALDARFLLARVHGELTELTVDQPHLRDPGLYVRLAGASVDAVLKRSFAPACDRVRAAAFRAGQVARLLQEGQRNLQHPPRLWTELAQSDVQGAIAFYYGVVPAAAKSCADPRAQGDLVRSAAGAETALRGFADFLRTDLLPRSDGNYALGPSRFAQMLHDEELIDEPLPALLERGYAELFRLQGEFTEVARKIDAKKTPAQVIADINLLHPKADALLPETRAQVAGIRRFVLDHAIVPIPPGEDLHIEETPLFYRQLSFASMSTPGPFEDRAREAYFYVTPVEPTWNAEQQEQHLRAYDRFSLENTIIHEAYPGHYVQGLYEHQAPTRLRKLLSSTAYSEGWALYCERMLLDAGFDPDPRERLIMLQWALLRAVRYVGTIEMHARAMPYSQVVRLLEERSYLDRANAEREAKRYTEDPLVLAYTYGQLYIDGLRTAEQRRLGPRFNLGEFHRRLLSQGPLPMALLGEAMGSPSRSAESALRLP